MKLSLLQSETDSSPRTVEGDWLSLIDDLRKPRVTECQPCPSLSGGPNKCGARMGVAWSPAVFNGKGRSAKNVVEMGCVVLDIDHVTMVELQRVSDTIDRLGWAAILHSTHSHNPPHDVCVRIIFPVSRPLTPAEITPTREHVQAELGIRADAQTKDHGRLYFLPSVPKGGPAFIFGQVDGKPVEPALSYGAPSVAVGASPSPPHAPPHRAGEATDLSELRKRLSASVARKFGYTTTLVRRALNRERLADAGGRDNALQSLCGSIGFTIPDAPIEAMLELIRESVMAMEPPESGDWLSVAREKLERAIARHAADVADKRAKSDAVREGLRSLTIDAEDPTCTGGYPPARIEAWAKAAGCSEFEWNKRWIIRHMGGNWIWVAGRYRSVVKDMDLEVSLMRDLARAPVKLSITDKDGNDQPRSMRNILRDYTTAARRVQGSLSARASWYDKVEECFHEAICPIRPELKPVHHEEVHRYMELFGGAPLLDWVAVVPQLDRPAAALYMKGPPGAGKDVLASGLARLWHQGGPSKFASVIGSNFNDTLMQCPLVFASEGIPKTDTVVDDIRRLVADQDHNLNRKFMPVMNLQGYIRLMIVANNERVLLDTGAVLGPDDIRALNERLLYIESGEASVEYLANFRKKFGKEYVLKWITEDRIAQHALWLSENRSISNDSRFAASGASDEMIENMTWGTGSVSAVGEFLCRMLSDRGSMNHPKLKTGNGKLLVNTELLADKNQWERFVPSRKVPSAKVISEALSQIAEKAIVEVEGVRFFDIKVGMLLRWSATHQVGEPPLMKKAIGI